MATTVSTTRAVLSGNLPLPILSNHLIIRSYRLSDLQEFHTLITEPEAMEGNNMSPDLSYTEELLEDQLPPYDTQVYLGIFLKSSRGEGDLIGDGGVHHLCTDGEWPELSYRFKKEYWNMGYATEFTTAFMEFWWSLPRVPVTIEVRANTLGIQGTPKMREEISTVPERVYASVKLDNKASQRVLDKAGFKLFEDKSQYWLTQWLSVSSEG